MAEQFVTCNLSDIVTGEPLPVSLHVYLDHRFITFRAAGDTLDRVAYDRLEFKKVTHLFVLEKDKAKLDAWIHRREAEAPPPLPPENKAFAKVREDVRRSTMDIFFSKHADKVIEGALSSSKALVTEVMKFPYAVSSLAQLQSYSKGTVDHSVNVSVLSVYLAMQMGYSHQVILQHVGTGGLLHDVGKPKVDVEDSDSPETIATKMKQHPTFGFRFLDAQDRVPNEVKMIVEQHHENFDGTGYPKKLRGGQIYDLARIVSIANVFDELVGEAKGSLQERQRHAIQQLDGVHYRKFDAQKLEKALKILKLGV